MAEKKEKQGLLLNYVVTIPDLSFSHKKHPLNLFLLNYTECSIKNQLVAIFVPQYCKYRVWDTQGVPCVYPKAMLAKKMLHMTKRATALMKAVARFLLLSSFFLRILCKFQQKGDCVCRLVRNHLYI